MLKATMDEDTRFGPIHSPTRPTAQRASQNTAVVIPDGRRASIVEPAQEVVSRRRHDRRGKIQTALIPTLLCEHVRQPLGLLTRKRLRGLATAAAFWTSTIT